MKKLSPKAKLKRAKHRLASFDPRGSNCPVCGREFRYGCEHSIKEAKERLEQNLMDASIDARLAEKGIL